ncbi:MAG: hypothetical protein Q8878_07015 [Bacillota bacterium]|nr:hypothetical protein [Bacillota bacterium]
MAKNTERAEVEDRGAAKFTVSQLAKSLQFTFMEKCVLRVILDPGGEYTVAEAKAAIGDFMKKEVD